MKREYANLVDMMAYDDLFRYFDNVVALLRRRIVEASGILVTGSLGDRRLLAHRLDPLERHDAREAPRCQRFGKVP